jgi:crotonobetainyl-CoA:carnitine CoA-transferase CaiB-like acyl-CoA transferase
MATTDPQYANLFKAIGRSELIEDSRFNSVTARSERFVELYEILALELAKESTATWEQRLTAASIPNARARMLDELQSDPYLVQTKFFQTLEHPVAGKTHTPSIPVRYSRTPAQLRSPAPILGEHTLSVLSEFGFSPEKIREITTPK